MDRNGIARRAFQAAVGGFKKANGSGLAVPEHLAGGSPGGENQNVGVCIIGHDLMPMNAAMALGATEYMLGRLGLPFTLISAKNDDPAVSRNTALAQVAEFKCGWALLVDSRVTFPPNAIPRLLEIAIAEKLDILGPTVSALAHPHQNQALPVDKGEVRLDGKVHEVGALPPALLLIRMSALGKLKRPYFRSPAIDEGEFFAPNDSRYPGCEGPCIVPDWVYFGAAARGAGLKVWLDAELSAFMVNWGECGYRLTGSEDQDPEKQFERVEHGNIRPPAAANQAGNVEISK